MNTTHTAAPCVRRRPRAATQRRAFTLVELLIVIGIITILIAILIPAISHVRRQAYATDSQAAINRIAVATEAYYQDFRAYPGPFSNDQIDAGIPSIADGGSPATLVPLTGAGVVTLVTQTENCLLGLAGGLQITTSAGVITAFTYAPDPVWPGPNSLNPLAPKRHSAYLDIKVGDLTGGQSGLPGSTDSVIPEFQDKFPEPKPILYLRARIGAVGISAKNNTPQYNYDHLAPYGFVPVSLDPQQYANFDVYLGNPSLANTPKGKDTFILIGAGADGKYGTKDDQNNFGGF